MICALQKEGKAGLLPVWAVLTGDIVGSSRLNSTERQALPARLRAASERVAGHFAKDLPFPLDLFRGDSWQLAIQRAELATRIALMMRALVRAAFDSTRLDTRISIGVGTVDFIPPDGLEAADGQAFRLSGEGLDRLTGDTRMGISLPGWHGPNVAEAFDVGLALIDLQARGWTQRQAEAVAGALVGLTQERIGREWVQHPVTQQAIAQHLDRAGWDSIERSVQFFERVLPILAGERDD